MKRDSVLSRLLGAILVGAVVVLGLSPRVWAKAKDLPIVASAKAVEVAMGTPAAAQGPKLDNEHFANHPTDTRGQGNLGQPTMRDPYGFDRDRSRLDTGNQGRPVQAIEPPPDPEADPDPVPEPDPEPLPEPDPVPDPDPLPEPVPEPTPEPEPVPPPVADLMPITFASSSFGIADNNTAYSELLNVIDPMLVKNVTWGAPEDPAITGYRVYQQAPGESAFVRYQEIDLARMGQGLYSQFTHATTGATMTVRHYTHILQGPIISLAEWRQALAWPTGTYRHYIAPYDANGVEGPPSAIVSSTNLGEIRILRPAPEQVLEREPAFEWADIWSDVPTAPGSWAFLEATVWQQDVYMALVRQRLPRGTTSFVYPSWAPALAPGRQYYALVTTQGWDGDSSTGYAGASKIVRFTVE